MKLPALERLDFPAFASDPEGNITWTNALWRERFGIAEGREWRVIFAELEAEDLRREWRACHEQQQSFAFETHTHGRHYQVICQPAEDDDGASRVLVVLSDITSHALMRAEAEAILDTAVDGIVIIDDTGRVEVFNQAAARLFGYDPAEVVGNNVTMLMPEPHRSAHGRYLQTYLRTGEAKIIGIGRELEAVNRAGRRIPVYLAVSEVKANGRRRFTGIIRDLSEQRAAREALTEQREKLAHVGRLSTMGEMTASIAHEINQPLTAISMYAQAGIRLIDGGNLDLDRLRDALDKLNTQSLRAGAVIERIQRFARAQESQREPVDVNELLKDLLALAESDARLHDVELQVSLAANLPEVIGDPIQIQQVALNLIRNAIDAMIEIDCMNGRLLTLTTSLPQPDLVRVSVVDVGPGVAEDQADLLFTPFHTTKKEGMGMGLSICRSIIGEHGGILSFRNNVGPGATFFFTLPAGTPDE